MSEHDAEPAVTPELDEVQQEESELELPVPAVPVHVDGPVQTHELPARISVMRGVTLGVSAEPVAGADLRRKRLVLISDTGAFLIGAERTAMTARWPAGLPLELRHTGAVWAAAESGTTLLTIVSEQWAD